jgi:hypothetical protein
MAQDKIGYTPRAMSKDSIPAAEVEVRHYAGVLRQAIRAAGLSVTEVERRLGVGPKSLRRVFGGQVDLKFKHVVAVLRVIGMSHEEFFSIALRRRRRRTSGGEFLAAFKGAGLRGELAPLPDELEDPASEEEFDRLVEDAVNRVMKRRGEDGVPPPLDEPPLDEPPLDEPPLDEPSLDEPPLGKPPLEEPPFDEPSLDEPPLGKPPLEEPPPDPAKRRPGPAGRTEKPK